MNHINIKIPRISVFILCFAAMVFPAYGAESSGAAHELQEGPPVASTVDLSGVDIAVGSKAYPEQRLLGYIAIVALNAAGANVTDETGLGGTAIARTALENGEIDLYSEYTGTAWVSILKKSKAIRDPEKLYRAVRTADAKNGIHWFEASPYNNTFSLVGVKDVMEKYDVATISDYADLVESHPKIARTCFGSEFRVRNDGLPGLEKAYNFNLPQSLIVDQGSEIAVPTMADQNQCNFAEADGTDPSIPINGLAFLVDDKNFFPVYQPAVTMRISFYKKNAGAYDKLFNSIAPLLDQETIVELNLKVQVEGMPPKVVATEFLRENNIIR